MAVEFFLGGGLGYLIGRATFAPWENFIKGYNDRLGHLSYNKIIEPIALYKKIEGTEKIYGEAVYCYLFGLPNASVPTIFRCLELGLKKKYEEVEGRTPKMKAYKLIEWSENFLKNQKELAHGFRFLRNLIHEEKQVEEQDALIALRHITKILNLLFPFSKVIVQSICNFCKTPYEEEVESNKFFIGNAIFIECNKCKRSTRYDIMPLYES